MSKLTALAAAALVAGSLAAQTNTADAGPRERLVGGLIAGAVVGSLIAGAHARSAYGHGYYVAPSYGCGYLRDRAVHNENMGRYGAAEMWWNRYNACLAR